MIEIWSYALPDWQWYLTSSTCQYSMGNGYPTALLLHLLKLFICGQSLWVHFVIWSYGLWSTVVGHSHQGTAKRGHVTLIVVIKKLSFYLAKVFSADFSDDLEVFLLVTGEARNQFLAICCSFAPHHLIDWLLLPGELRYLSAWIVYAQFSCGLLDNIPIQ